MTRTKYLNKLLLLCLIAAIAGCGKPSISEVEPGSGGPHTLVDITGNTLFSKILWDTDTLPGGVLGGGPISVPHGASIGNHDIRAYRDGQLSDTTVVFNVTDPALMPFPDPKIYHVSAYLVDSLTPDSVRMMLFAQGPNIDVSATMEINGVAMETRFWSAIRNDLNGMDPTTFNYPIYHYSMVFAYMDVEIGDVLNVQIFNDGGAMSNNMNYTVATFADWDSDGDGIKDDWEQNGYDKDGDGTLEIDFPGLGAHYLVLDEFIETDFMDGPTPASADHIPNSGTWQILFDAFYAAPFINIWGGYQGIQLHIDYGQDTFVDIQGNVIALPASEIRGGTIMPYDDYTRFDGAASPDEGAGESTANFYTYKYDTAYFDTFKRGDIFHYAQWVNDHGYTSNLSGRGEVSGNDFFVSLPSSYLNVAGRSAGTFMHEYGHNLGLLHGGFENEARKPNHLSVMEYYKPAGPGTLSYQFGGVDNVCGGTLGGIYQYSLGMNNSIDENSVDESIGICGGVGIDWDGDGVFGVIMWDMRNFSDDPGNTYSVLQDHEDWEDIIFVPTNPSFYEY